MRGYPNFNFAAFDEAAARGRALGHEIISPAELDRQAGFSEKGHDGKVNEQGHSQLITIDFMRDAIHRDVAAIVGTADKPGVDAVAMLAGWQMSKGATGEKALADWLGLPVFDARTFEPLDSRVQDRAIVAVLAERLRQDRKWGSQRRLTKEKWLTILVEEVGEVANAILDGTGDELREEIVQVAAVAVLGLEIGLQPA
jgi:hypothetical protein